ncbi:uncharacterized protein SPPG_04097 [Spizellomyces punctatus DAOM BR117]|uniref:Uncharacterized protein n=1 Tax=Spizellomyces punctatus (strain DAOM BR117) TaxID=645134 RepID=A0A0L0HHQ4_SPIPD|nr:uncharacterized protein SPPG_04097 [Spizellomyces punctatus DAOM BR117]KND01001.1 hypothetical protein SPPG_04097 [Spizellomyces punctatus DAOM BR117]|eukprot:XP_016609040.1 hypothetical protein SPPG_04097 [Spizellomyces punctatus DAOM BR117]
MRTIGTGEDDHRQTTRRVTRTTSRHVIYREGENEYLPGYSPIDFHIAFNRFNSLYVQTGSIAMPESQFPLGHSENPYELLIVGAGPHALTLLVRLLTKYPVTLFNDEEQDRLLRHVKHQKGCGMVDEARKRKYLVVDEGGEWLSRWKKLFAGYDIPWLRSLVNIHPDASRRMNSAFNHSQNTTLHVPTSSLFIDFCAHLVEKHHLNDVIQQGSVHCIKPMFDSSCNICKGFEIDLLHNGHCKKIHASRVVCAIGNGNCLRLPDWVPPCDGCNTVKWPKECLMHSAELVKSGVLNCEGCCSKEQTQLLPTLREASKGRLMIVGGGLTAAHLVKHGVKRFDQVLLVSRSFLRVKHFDVSLNWIDRYGNVEMAKFWQENDPRIRLKIIQNAREGGSMTPSMWEYIESAKAAGSLETKQYTEIISAIWRTDTHCACDSAETAKGFWEVHLSDGSIENVHAIWMATGSKMNVTQDPLLSQICKAVPTTLIEGFPVLTHDLRWQSSIPLYVMGGYAALQLGPNALNLAGAKIASERIVEALETEMGFDQAHADDGAAVVGGWANRYKFLEDEDAC